MKRWIFSVGLVASLVCGCSDNRVVFRRVDGQRMAGNPALTQQQEVDMAICNGEMAKADIRGAYARDGYKTVFLGCMAQRGYLEVPINDASH